MNIGDALRFFRTKFKLSQKEMTPDFMDASAYSRIEANIRSVKTDELQEIFKKIGILSSEFFMFYDLDPDRTKFKELYFYCGAHLNNKTTKKKLVDYYNTISKKEDKSISELSNYIAIKNYFGYHWDEIEKVQQEEADEIFNLMMQKSFYTQYDYLIISNLIRLFTPKQIDLIIPRIIPIPFEDKRNLETKRYAYNTLINVISLNLYSADYDSAEKFIKLAKRQNKIETDYYFKLNLQYLSNLFQYLVTGDMVFLEKVHAFVHVLEDIGEDFHAEQVKTEVKVLTHDKNSKQMLKEYKVGLFKKN